MGRPCASPAIVWFATAANMLAEISVLRAPWFKSGCMSDLAKTPQREAMVYIFSYFEASASISSSGTLSSVAIWSINAPVPPAHEPFMRTSIPPERKSIFASSPPSSMITSVPGTRRLAAMLVAYTSCINGRRQVCEMPMPAEPDTVSSALCPPMTSRLTFSKSPVIFSVIFEKCLS